jgi:hypothetical protein
MMHEQDQRQSAIDLAVEAKVLIRCPYHGEVYDAETGDLAPACMLGNRRFTEGALRGLFSDRREMTDAIKAAVEDSAMDCWLCEKQREED